MKAVGRPNTKIKIDVIFPQEQIERFFSILKNRNKVTVAGLGIFEIRDVKSRIMYHNQAKSNIRTKAGKKLKFIPMLHVKQLINR